MTCPCGSDRLFNGCCEPLLLGGLANSPEALMRSRFCAYVQKNIEYIVATTDPQMVADLDVEAASEWAKTSEFFKLEVLRSSDEGNKGTVEFKAHYRMHAAGGADGVAQVHHEISKFRKRSGRWYFHDGRVIEDKG